MISRSFRLKNALASLANSARRPRKIEASTLGRDVWRASSRRWCKSPIASPSAFLILPDGSLFGIVKDEAVRNAWFLPSLGELRLWWPANFVSGQQVDWGVIAKSSVEIGSLCGVMAMALLLKWRFRPGISL